MVKNSTEWVIFLKNLILNQRLVLCCHGIKSMLSRFCNGKIIQTVECFQGFKNKVLLECRIPAKQTENYQKLKGSIYSKMKKTKGCRPKGRMVPPKLMNFWKSSKRGWGGHFQSKNLCCRFWTLNRAFSA